MTKESILTAMNEIISRCGPWTGSSLYLREGVYTNNIEQFSIDTYVNILADFGYENLKELRILDLACLEGQIAIEFARLGSRTVGIDGRAINIKKAKFAMDTIGLQNSKFYLDNVLDISQQKYGIFDIVFCCGILYHLDLPDIIASLNKIFRVLKNNGLLIINTHIALDVNLTECDKLGDMTSAIHNGHVYDGKYFREYEPGASQLKKELSPWSSLDNEISFWMTRNSLFKALKNIGFNLVYENLHNSIGNTDRSIFICKKKERAHLRIG